MKEKTNNFHTWIIVVLIVVLIAYFGYVITTKPSLSPAASANVAVGCYGQKSDGDKAGSWSGDVYYDGTFEGFKVALKAAMPAAVGYCKSDVGREQKEYEEFLAEVKKCDKNICIFTHTATNTLDSNTCKVKECSVTSGGMFCEFKVENGILVEPAERCTITSISGPSVNCFAEDNDWQITASCMPR